MLASDACDLKDFRALTADQVVALAELLSAVLHKQGPAWRLVTGGAGTGKSTVVRLLSAVLRRRGKPFILTAYTNSATAQIGGTKSFEACIGTAFIRKILDIPEHVPLEVKRIFAYLQGSRPHVIRRLGRENIVLIVDECSMIPPDVLQLLSDLLRTIGSQMRVVLVGDFRQLPPVTECPVPLPDRRLSAYGFSTQAWAVEAVRCHLLMKFVRGAQQMAPVLDRMARAAVSEEDVALLKRLRLSDGDTEFQMTAPTVVYLYGNRALVNHHNSDMYGMLPGAEYTLSWSFSSSLPARDPFFQKICKGFVDAVFAANDSEGYNGHIRGVVHSEVHFTYKVGCNVIFTHLSDLAKLQKVEVAHGKVEYRRLAGAGMTHIKVQKGMRGVIVDVFQAEETGAWHPVVFMVGDAYDKEYVLVQPVLARERYVNPEKNQQVTLQVRVVPVMYGWACTVHYVQGKTLRCNVVLHLPSMWEVGMSYVGFSRPVTLLENMRVRGLEDDATAASLNGTLFKVSGLVEDFYKAIEPPRVEETGGDVECITLDSDAEVGGSDGPQGLWDDRFEDWEIPDDDGAFDGVETGHDVDDAQRPVRGVFSYMGHGSPRAGDDRFREYASARSEDVLAKLERLKHELRRRR